MLQLDCASQLCLPVVQGGAAARGAPCPMPTPPHARLRDPPLAAAAGAAPDQRRHNSGGGHLRPVLLRAHDAAGAAQVRRCGGGLGQRCGRTPCSSVCSPQREGDGKGSVDLLLRPPPPPRVQRDAQARTVPRCPGRVVFRHAGVLRQPGSRGVLVLGRLCVAACDHGWVGGWWAGGWAATGCMHGAGEDPPAPRPLASTRRQRPPYRQAHEFIACSLPACRPGH